MSEEVAPAPPGGAMAAVGPRSVFKDAAVGFMGGAVVRGAGPVVPRSCQRVLKRGLIEIDGDRTQ